MKRILTLDGGGVKGVFSLQILATLESLLRAERNNPHLVLADEFDYFAGTSTGALIAAGLCWGMPVAQIEDYYFNQGQFLFTRESLLNRWKSKYRQENISHFFRGLFCDSNGSPATLGSRQLKKYLLVVTRNASTGAAWPVTNNPHAMYNQSDRDDCNLNIPLWQLLRASSAAPTYFPPQEINIGKRTDLFLDGGVTPYNNPSMITFLSATLPQYQLNWKTGTEALHLTSIGAGKFRSRLALRQAQKITLLAQLSHFIPAILGSAVDNQDLMCRVMGNCVYGDIIDSELGDLMNDQATPVSHKQFNYVRYNTAFDTNLSTQIQLALARMDNLNVMPLLRDLGQEYAQKNVQLSHIYSEDY